MGEFVGRPGSNEWWPREFRVLIDRFGSDRIARNVTCVEFHGYHSLKYKLLPVTLPSQHYGFTVVRAAMDREAVIIVARGYQEWNVAVPGLRKYPGRVDLVNRRNSAVSPKNCVGDGFARVVAALDASNPTD